MGHASANTCAEVRLSSVPFMLIYVCYLLFCYTLFFPTLSSTMFLAQECWVTGIFIKQGWWSETIVGSEGLSHGSPCLKHPHRTDLQEWRVLQMLQDLKTPTVTATQSHVWRAKGPENHSNQNDGFYFLLLTYFMDSKRQRPLMFDTFSFGSVSVQQTTKHRRKNIFNICWHLNHS